MILNKILDKFGRTIILTDEHWRHIILRHPELKNHQADLAKTLAIPDIIVQNELDQKILLYHKFYKQVKAYIVVIVQTERKFVITRYISLKIKRGKIIWQDN